MMGHKIEWMRENPLVCVEIDDVRAPDDWSSVVVIGRYEELSEQTSELVYAHELLRKRPMWWEPGSVPVAGSTVQRPSKPVFYRISVGRVTGRVALPSDAAGAA